ncbi:MAG: endolytic transglycosylase MltG [Muribaculaceae bacterium]|nr:endolytic transglycosylase MltG [Muribaculaceae bacterium]
MDNIDNKPQPEKKSPKRKKGWLIAGGALLLIVLGAAAWALPYFTTKAPHEAMLYMKLGTPLEEVGDSLRAKLGDEYTDRVMSLLRLTKANLSVRHGAFKIEEGESAWALMRHLRSGPTTPIRVTFNNVRTKGELSRRLTARLMMDSTQMRQALDNDTLCQRYGMDTTSIVTMFLPDTYMFEWDISPEALLNAMHTYYNKFWTDANLNKAKAIGLTPQQVATLASIVDEETAKADEKPMVARLYLNRLERGIKLQADPTVKFALGDFTIRRITNAMLQVESPYNTYRVTGLPPGPIRLPEKATLEAVLNAPQHDYIFMCAREDFSGYHNFATTNAEHEANARRYHQALNERGIK